MVCHSCPQITFQASTWLSLRAPPPATPDSTIRFILTHHYRHYPHSSLPSSSSISCLPQHHCNPPPSVVSHSRTSGPGGGWGGGWGGGAPWWGSAISSLGGLLGAALSSIMGSGGGAGGWLGRGGGGGCPWCGGGWGGPGLFNVSVVMWMGHRLSRFPKGPCLHMRAAKVCA